MARCTNLANSARFNSKSVPTCFDEETFSNVTTHASISCPYPSLNASFTNDAIKPRRLYRKHCLCPICFLQLYNYQFFSPTYLSYTNFLTACWNLDPSTIPLMFSYLIYTLATLRLPNFHNLLPAGTFRSPASTNVHLNMPSFFVPLYVNPIQPLSKNVYPMFNTPLLESSPCALFFLTNNVCSFLNKIVAFCSFLKLHDHAVVLANDSVAWLSFQ